VIQARTLLLGRHGVDDDFRAVQPFATTDEP
jgi:hypothetical protein